MQRPRIEFEVLAADPGSEARRGRFVTLHGVVDTPAFMPVGTQATVKAQTPDTVAGSGAQVVLANTYHLLLRPGPEVFKALGGIHRFMSWDRAVLTDSGGYQIFSLPHSRSITDEGAVFQSYVDGRSILLSPRVSIETQKAIGSDIMMALDQCVPSTSDRATTEAALRITHRWAEESLEARGDSPQALFGIVQGALFPDLRERSVEAIASLPFDGLAIGGLAVGESKEEREGMCEVTAKLLPRDRPRYLMGVGTPIDILEAVRRGVDMFDCIIPTQMAQRGGAYTSRGFVQMRRSVHRLSEGPLDPACECPTCGRFSRAYLHHLVKASETLGWHLLGQHNLWFYQRLMEAIRASLVEGRFDAFYREHRESLVLHDVDHEPSRPRPARRPPEELGAFAVRATKEGFGLILHKESGETMHAHTAPIEEARRLYSGQADLRRRLVAHGEGEPPLAVWDLGLGAGANAIAALEAYSEAAAQGPVRGMTLLSFEIDLDALRLACGNLRLFPYLRHGGPGALIERGVWRTRKHPGLEWRLVPGDFRLTMKDVEPAPDVVFFDPFSRRTNESEWSVETFRALAERALGRDVEIFTYTASTAARAAMLLAGLHVARGVPSDVKSETTIALSPLAVSRAPERGRELLGAAWLARWERSHEKLPRDVQGIDREAAEARIRSHPQFREPGIGT